MGEERIIMAKASAAPHRTNKSEQTRERIIESYLTLIREKKWDKISVIEICRQSDITRGTFYQYFSDIYDMMEQIETSLLTELSNRFASSRRQSQLPVSAETFFTNFNPAPPEIFLTWFEFCRNHKQAMMALLDRKNGDTYFVKRLKPLISSYIQDMMDRDGVPRDELRSHFVDIFIELHFLSAQTWLDSDDSMEIMDIDDIVNLLNVMRVGALYMSLKHREDPERFDEVMHTHPRDHKEA